MNSGIAKDVRLAFPEAYEADRETLKGDREKLGSTSVAKVDRGGTDIIVVNGYTQFHWRGSGVRADYDAIRSVMSEVKARFQGKRIGYPRIGAGLAKGDWSKILRIIAEELDGEDHTLVEFAP